MATSADRPGGDAGAHRDPMAEHGGVEHGEDEGGDRHRPSECARLLEAAVAPPAGIEADRRAHEQLDDDPGREDRQ